MEFRRVLFRSSSAQWTTCSPASIPGCANIFTGRGRARLPQASRPIMEIKSNNILIGFSTLIVLVLILGFSLWISRVQLDRQYAYYKIVFSGSVSGLSKSGPVQFNGLPVGRVIDLSLAERDPSKVIAIIQVDARTPVKQDSIAQLEIGRAHV